MDTGSAGRGPVSCRDRYVDRAGRHNWRYLHRERWEQRRPRYRLAPRELHRPVAVHVSEDDEHVAALDQAPQLAAPPPIEAPAVKLQGVPRVARHPLEVRLVPIQPADPTDALVSSLPPREKMHRMRFVCKTLVLRSDGFY